MAQSQKTSQGGASLPSKKRPLFMNRRPCSLYDLNLQLDSGDGSSHKCHPPDCLKRWQSDHACHYPDRFNELATKSEKWNGKSRQECVHDRHPPSKSPVGVLPWTCQREGKWTLTSGLLLRRSKVLRNLWHYMRAQSQGHHTFDRLEERGVKRGSARRSSLKGRERAIVNQTNIGTVSKATLGKLNSERRSEAHFYELFQAHRYHLELNWTELLLQMLASFGRYDPVWLIFVTHKWRLKCPRNLGHYPSWRGEGWWSHSTLLCIILKK